MVEHLSTLVENFPGAANKTRCFTHILNLVAKSILWQFEARKTRKAGDNSEDADDAKKALASLARELEIEYNTDMNEELAELEEEDVDSEEESEVDLDRDDNEDGLGDELNGMSKEEVAELEETVIPIRLMLTKVSRLKRSGFL